MDKIKVLIVDDSSVIRSIVRAALSNDSAIEVVGEAEDPFEARELIKELNPDVLTLDVEMPKMDGITFLKNLMRLRPLPVVMLSTLTTKGADITLEALDIGAIDFIAKPTVEEITAQQEKFDTLLIDKVKGAVSVDQKNFALSKAGRQANEQILPFTGVQRANHIVAIGASTGGTEALKNFLMSLPENSPPIVIAQHIPKTFSARFAERLNNICQITVHEAQHGQKIKTGHAYIAPGSLHLEVVEKGGSLFCTLSDGVPVNRHKPAVDVLFDSLLTNAGNVQAILLTGMGKDGAQGMLRLKEAGANTIVQDKSTSLIWGMPGQAFGLNAHRSVLPLNEIPKAMLDYAGMSLSEMKDYCLDGVINDV